MNADKHRCFLAFAYGEANNKRFYLCLSAFICGKNAFIFKGVIDRKLTLICQIIPKFSVNDLLFSGEPSIKKWPLALHPEYALPDRWFQADGHSVFVVLRRTNHVPLHNQ